MSWTNWKEFLCRHHLPVKVQKEDSEWSREVVGERKKKPRSSSVIVSSVTTLSGSQFLDFLFFLFFFFSFIFISWRLITLQYCSGFCHTLTWISHGFTCVPHPDLPSHLPLHPIRLGLPSVGLEWLLSSYTVLMSCQVCPLPSKSQWLVRASAYALCKPVIILWTLISFYFIFSEETILFSHTELTLLLVM